MKKYIGKNEKGEIISYEEVKDEKELKNKLKKQKEKFIQKEEEQEEIKKQDRIKTKEWVDYWYAVNWSEEADARYYGLKLFWFVITFPFALINRIYLIITKKDFGPECENLIVFIIKRVIPFILILYICFCTIQKLNSVDLNKYKKIVNHNNSLLLDPQYLEEQKIAEQKRKDGYIFLDNKRGWYKSEGISSKEDNRETPNGEPLNWRK